MPRKRKIKRPRLIDVLPSLVKMVPEVKLERIENIYPVFENRTVCLKRDRISFQKAASHETQKITSDNTARVCLQKTARLENQKVATNDNTPIVSLPKAVSLENQKVAANHSTSRVSLQKTVISEHQRAAANYNTARVYLKKTEFLEYQKIATTVNTGRVNLQKTAGVENQKVATTDKTEGVHLQKTAGLENQKVAAPNNTGRIKLKKIACLQNQKIAPTDNTTNIYLQKTAGLENQKVATNDNTARVYLQKTAGLENQKVAPYDNTAGVNNSDDDDVNDDALFEYEVDLENLSQDVTIQTELINDDRQDAVVAVNLVPEFRAVINKQEEVMNISSSDANSGSVMPNANADAGQSFEAMDLQAYSLADSAVEHAECSTKENFEKQESDDDDEIMVLLDTTKEESDSRKQQSESTPQQQTDSRKEQSGSSEQQPDSKPEECMSILSTTWALADCVSAKQTSSAREVEMVEYGNDNTAAKKVHYPCTKCNRSFDTQEAFSAHECSKSELNKSLDGFICPWCEKQFLSLKELNQHVRICWRGLLTCVICSGFISGKLGIIKHLQDHKKQSRQSQTRENACLVCGLFDEKWNLIEHWRGHTGVNLLRCVVCKKIFDLSSLVEHLNVHRRSDPECAELNWCQSCGLTFRNKAAFSHHRNGHSSRKYSHMCESCGMFFESFNDLEQHILYHVDSNTVYKCSKCKKIYPFRAHYDIHCKTCFKTDGGTQALTMEMGEKCLKIFKTHTLDLIRYAIKQDIVKQDVVKQDTVKQDTVKAGNKVPPKQIKVTQTPQSTSNFVLMKLRKEDNTAVLYSCQVCQKRLVGRSSFMRHWREHTGYNPNKCIICSDVFAMPKLLEMHLSIAHAASCYKCTNCSMIFRTVLEHKYHTLAHLKNNVFFCEVCGAGFNEFNYLEYHVFTNHVKECEIRNNQLNPKSTPAVNFSVSTEESQSAVNGIVGNNSVVQQSSGSNANRSTNSSAAVNYTTAASTGGVNLQSPVISSSNISNSSAVVNQVITIADPPPLQVNPIPNVGVVQQTSTVIAPQISLPDFYMCTVCKAISPDLPTMMAHTKTHKA